MQVTKVDTVTVTATDGATNVAPGKTLQFHAAVTGQNLDAADEAVTWSISGSTNTGTSIGDSGLLTVAANETATQLTVTATSVFDTTKAGNLTVDIGVETKTIDDVEFWVLAKRPNEQDPTKTDALIWAKEAVVRSKFNNSNTNVWNESCTAYIELQTWLGNTATLKDKAIDTTIYTRNGYGYNGKNNYYEMTTKVFLLSEADLFGTANGIKGNAKNPLNEKEYTWGTERLTTDPKVLGNSSSKDCWLRSPRTTFDFVAYVDSRGESYDHRCTDTCGLRPALWVTLD